MTSTGPFDQHHSYTSGLLATGSGLVLLLVLLPVFKVSHLSIAQVREQGPRTLSWWRLLLSLSLIMLGFGGFALSFALYIALTPLVRP